MFGRILYIHHLAIMAYLISCTNPNMEIETIQMCHFLNQLIVFEAGDSSAGIGIIYSKLEI
jgi:hypothetical protein